MSKFAFKDLFFLWVLLIVYVLVVAGVKQSQLCGILALIPFDFGSVLLKGFLGGQV